MNSLSQLKECLGLVKEILDSLGRFAPRITNLILSGLVFLLVLHLVDLLPQVERADRPHMQAVVEETVI